ncbi:MAG: NlpC/P60 family protein [Pseudomonadota bacterium]
MADPCSADVWSADPGLSVVAAARGWIGTPYRHQASCKGVGADCLGLVRGIWRETLGAEPERPGAYSPDWAEAAGEERLLRAAARHLIGVPAHAAVAGDVLLFRMIESGPAKHVAILSSEGLPGGRIIHAYSGHDVCETHLTEAWIRRLAAVFRFPL